MAIKGIDISKYQGVIDWQRVKGDGVKFAIIRVGWCGYDGSITLDEKFHQNMRAANAVGMDVGVYLYSYANSIASARVAAAETLELVKGYRLTYPICFDIEETKHTIYTKNSKANNNAICSAFLDTIEQAGYYGMLYTYSYFSSAYLDMAKLSKYDLWIADYRPALGYKGAHGIWQYSSKGSVNGILGNVDMNHGYRDYAELIVRLGLNGLGGNAPEKPVEPTPPHTEGKWCAGKFDERTKDRADVAVHLNAIKQIGYTVWYEEQK